MGDLFQEVGGEMIRLRGPEVVATLVKDSVEMRVVASSSQARREVEEVVKEVNGGVGSRGPRVIGWGTRDRRVGGSFRKREVLGGRVLEIGGRGVSTGDETTKFRVKEGDVGEEVEEGVGRRGRGRGDEVGSVNDGTSGY